MSKFIFAQLQLVIVPADMAGAEGVQGVVTEGAAKLSKETTYLLQWPNTSKPAADSGLLEMTVGVVSEADLIAAQPGPMITADLANLNAELYARQQCEHVRAELKREYAAKLRKSARKRTRK